MPTTETTVEDEVLTQLAKTSAKAERMLSERDMLIIKAFALGSSLRRIAEHAGMTHVGVKKLVDRHQADLVLVNEDGDVMSVIELKQTATSPEASEALLRRWQVVYRVDYPAPSEGDAE